MNKIYGYASPIVSPVYEWDDLVQNGQKSCPIGQREIQIGVTDPKEYKVTIDEHRERSNILEVIESNRNLFPKSHVQEVYKRLGLTGKCHISWELKTVHPLEFVHLPLYHILFSGIVKDFLRHVFRQDTTGTMRHEEITPSSKGLHLFNKARNMILRNCDMSDPCIDLTNTSGWFISSLVAFVEVHSCFMFNERVMGAHVLSSMGKEAWGHLRHAIMYFLRDPEETMSIEEWKYGRGKSLRSAAKQSLIEYAKICEQFMPCICVSNLHISICRLFDQEEYSGRSNICHDLFTERVARKLKKFSYKKDHEKSFVYRQLQREACKELAKEYVVGKDAPRGRIPSRGEKYDTSNNETCLLGCGEECYPFERVYQQTKQFHMSLSEYDENLDTNANSPWGNEYKVYSHSELYLKYFDRFETVKSLRCLKEVDQNSKVAVVTVEGSERLVLVDMFSRVSRQNQTVSRFVQCHVFKYENPDDDPCTGKVYRYRHYGSLSSSTDWVGQHCDEDFEEMDVILPVEAIVGKVVQYMSPVSYVDSETNKEYHMVYCARSRSRSGQTRQGEQSWLE